MFLDFFYHLRDAGLRISVTEWLTFIEALVRGHARSNLEVFYRIARATLVKRETEWDRFDQAFASFFEGVEMQFALDDALLDWLSNPILPRELTEAERAALPSLDLDTLRDEFLKRLQEQTERHDGGSKWVGTGGTSPFGHGGTNPAGIRVGGTGGGRSAVQIAGARAYRNLRSDRTLDTRQMGAALQRLRRLDRDDGVPELDLERTIDKTAREGGEIELVFGPPRRNRVKLLLLLDVGGSMDPHAELCERLFSAAHKATHFKAFQSYYFHNCVYDQLYRDMAQMTGPRTDEVLAGLDPTWFVLLVGDAYMHPFELTRQGGAIDFARDNRRTGLDWLQEFRRRCPSSIWLNPEPERLWDAPSIRLVRSVFPMFGLTLDGLTEGIDTLRGRRQNTAFVEAFHNPFETSRR